MALAALVGAASAMAASPAATVYTQTNDPAGNRIQVLEASPGGALTPTRSFPTGGQGSGSGLGSQGAVVIAHRWLLAVNAGSDELSLFRLRRRGLALSDVVPSGGDQPISVTSDGRRVYVLNAGDQAGVAGFDISGDGRLVPIVGSTQPLSAPGAGPAQIERSPDGRTLVVTEKNTNRIGTYPVAEDGTVGTPTFTALRGRDAVRVRLRRARPPVRVRGLRRPAGRERGLVVRPARGWRRRPDQPGRRDPSDGRLLGRVTKDGRFAYATNTGSDSVTGYRIAKDGAIALLDGDGVTATTGDGPTDMVLDRTGRVLYVLNGAEGSISAFTVGKGGELGAIGTVTGLPAGAVAGLAAR